MSDTFPLIPRFLTQRLHLLRRRRHAYGLGWAQSRSSFFDIQRAKSNIEDKKNGRNALKLEWICCIIIGWNDFSKMIMIIALELLAMSKIFTSLRNCLACPCPRQQMRSWRLLAVWSLLPRRQRRWARWIRQRPGQRQIYTQYILIFWNQILIYSLSEGFWDFYRYWCFQEGGCWV